ncbi:MAG: winged helix-turn-helix domain-containing protein [Candidatus Bathyarchaeales archaeon]
MVKYRRRIEIIADILNAAKNGAKKTRIMYVANLSYELLEKYLAEVVNIGFVRLKNDGYEVTEKGRLFLEKYEQFSSKYSRLHKEMENVMFEREILEKMCGATDDVSAKLGFRRSKAN